tara:strand:+ start:474 stop:665 length:192 start_codon:yes stop_codon:yes gene_type:complete
LEITTIISCPYCYSDTLVILDGVDGDVDLVSDCKNSFRPINVRGTVEAGEVVGIEAGLGIVAA